MKIVFSQIEEKIDELNKINVRASYAQSRKYDSLFWEIYESLVEMENREEIIVEQNKKHISYLKEILKNDGPEYCYTIIFWPKEYSFLKYEIGVCVRGIPILKKVV